MNLVQQTGLTKLRVINWFSDRRKLIKRGKVSGSISKCKDIVMYIQQKLYLYKSVSVRCGHEKLHRKKPETKERKLHSTCREVFFRFSCRSAFFCTFFEQMLTEIKSYRNCFRKFLLFRWVCKTTFRIEGEHMHLTHQRQQVWR